MINREDIKSRVVVRNKKYMTEEVIIGTCLMKDSQKGWIEAVIYSGKDRNTNQPNLFTKNIEDFCQEFNLISE